MRGFVIFALVVVGLSLVDAQVSDCNGKLEEGIAGLKVPSEIVQAAQEFKANNPELVEPYLPATFQRPAEVTKYLEQLPEDRREKLVGASGSFLSASMEMLRTVDCDRRELFKLIDVSNSLYKFKVNPGQVIDTFNGYYELSQRVFYNDFFAQNFGEY